MNEIQFVSVDRVLAKFHRDLRDTSVNETDMIEWIGEALGFLKVQQIQEEAVAFLEVKNYETDVPQYFNMVIQVARKNNWAKEDKCSFLKEIKTEYKVPANTNNSCGCEEYADELKEFEMLFGLPEEEFHKSRLSLQWSYNLWRNSNLYKREFTPVRLSNHTFFNSIVCKEKGVYYHCKDEYTIVGTTQKKLRFSFKEGLIALAYLRTAIDRTTGYPLIPDNESYMAAITYYIKWKIAEWYQWNGREGFQQTLPAEMERKWLKYAKQAKNYMKMPKSLDEYQNIMEQTYSLPNHYKYDNYFGGQAPRYPNKVIE